MHVSEGTHVPPDWVSEWKQSRIIFVTLLGYKKIRIKPFLCLVTRYKNFLAQKELKKDEPFSSAFRCIIIQF